jgi:quinoprotein glucose dehydrogenase
LADVLRQPGRGSVFPRFADHRENVARLRVAWTYRTGALDVNTPLNQKAAFETTPILAAGRLFFTTPYDHVVALDPASGAKLWEFDAKLDLTHGYSEVTSRGVAAWADPKARPGEACALRIFPGTLDGRLIALDGASGHRVAASGPAAKTTSRVAWPCAIPATTRSPRRRPSPATS